MNFKIEELKFDENGLIPAIVQDAQTREVLTLAYVNAESLQLTLAEKQTWFWSRSRNALWHKGETSGNTQRVVELALDCDGDALVILVEPAGPACHTGAQSCFHNQIVESPMSNVQSLVAAPVEGSEISAKDEDLGALLGRLYRVIESRRQQRPEGSYTSYLFNEGLDKILKKLGEESAETIIAAKNEDPQPLIAETSDLIYHLLVMLVERGVALDRIRDELSRRKGKQGDK